ncbi:hypothetical protein BBJ28_00024937 [Nothophytophthora sp. Chile5]|nr:hypothetical protein BBJ28_00024937 [Nothophytophthora sp. Chile5]
MGRKQSAERLQFKDLRTPCNSSQTWHHCIHCLNAAEEDASIAVVAIRGNNPSFLRHLHACQYAPSEWRVAQRDGNRASRTKENLTPTPFPTVPFETTGKQTCSFAPLTPEQILEFHKLLVEFQADNRLPDTFIARPSTRRLLQFINPACAAALPSRRLLGGSILDTYETKASEEDVAALREMQDKTEGLVNFLSDVWKNVSKTHLLGCQLALFGIISTIGLDATNSRHDGLALAEQMERIMISVVDAGWHLGAVVTDNAGQCSRARRILALRWPKVVFLICFAHDINNLVKSILHSPSFHVVTAQASAAVKCLNSSSSKWLLRVRTIMTRTYGYHLSFIQLCETRWNSMQGCFASLLRAETALGVFVATYRGEFDFPEVLEVFEDRSFWDALREAEVMVNPLCFASFKLQSDENTLADVVICFRDLNDGFVASEYSEELVQLLEKRWCACEQPLFMLAMYLHPAYVNDARALPNSDVSGIDAISKFAVFYFKRLIGGDPGSIRGEMADWIMGDFIDATLDDFQNVALPPLPAFWRFVKQARPKSALPRLAMTVLSIAVNTATCERYFSELALIHTARRNRLSADKARKIAVVRKHVRELDRKTTSRKEVVPPDKRIVPTEEPKRLTFGTPNRRRSSSHCISPSVLHVEVESHATNTEAVSADGEGGNTFEGQEDLGECDDPLTHWESIFEELVDSDSGPEDGDVSMEDDWHDSESTEEVESSERRPFPDFNDRSFPQEAMQYLGLRGRKTTLGDLFVLEQQADPIATRLEF